MRIRTLLFLVFLTIPLVEIALFVVMGRRIGLGWTLAVVVVTAVVGSAMVARQGREAWFRLQREVASGVFPGKSLADGAMILVSGALLVTPGFLTDTIGFLLLVPPVRAGIRAWALRRSRDRWVVVP